MTAIFNETVQGLQVYKIENKEWQKKLATQFNDIPELEILLSNLISQIVVIQVEIHEEIPL